VRLQVTLDTGQKVLVELPSHGVGVTLGARTGLRILVESVIVEEMVPSQAP
jgi:hypothetical protein